MTISIKQAEAINGDLYFMCEVHVRDDEHQSRRSRAVPLRPYSACGQDLWGVAGNSARSGGVSLRCWRCYLWMLTIMSAALEKYKTKKPLTFNVVRGL